ncbi:lipoma-preferred partner homolog [Lytechinus variegatus]|uniref:lipoma-preferred partner homolog n=1 Tax=Lytechinus variegatus TaxID=7654 RepID=UPI001BB17BFD|nr:lipoma-preferred partner homolog [Lytechinus variegatus]
MTTMQRLNQDLDQLDSLRAGGNLPQNGQYKPGSLYTQKVTTTQTFYGTQPKKYAPVVGPKPRNALPPSGSKGAPPPTLPKPSGYYRPTASSKGPPPMPPPKTSQRHHELSYVRGLPSYAPVDLPPPPSPDQAYGGRDDAPLPPPPPELMGSSPPAKPSPTMQTYNEPHPAVQPGYRQPSYRQPAAPTPGPTPAAKPSYHVPQPTDQPISAPAKSGAEAEIDALTNLLVANMGTSSEPKGEFFGICARCGTNVEGENNGCTAMEQVYHVDCFTCENNCGIKLRGQPFYALEGKAFCEHCYFNTLERCSTCSKHITDRILRATGKPYHPDCFTCVVCGKSLDGVPFTVDATNQIHCIEDFHRKFAPRCSVCLNPIMPEDGQEETVRIVAMDRSFHVHCYKCEDCGVLLSSEADGRGCYPLDDHILCRECNGKRVQSL